MKPLKAIFNFVTGNTVGAIKELLPARYKKKLEEVGIDQQTINKVLGVQKQVLEGLSNDPEFLKHMADKEVEMERIYAEDAESQRRLEEAYIRSEDGYVRRARPTWLYVLMAIMACRIALFPFIAMVSAMIDSGTADTVKTVLADFPIPPQFWTATLYSFLGYGGYRTIDKMGGPRAIIERIRSRKE